MRIFRFHIFFCNIVYLIFDWMTWRHASYENASRELHNYSNGHVIYYNNIFGKTWLRSIVATIFHFFSWSPRSFFTFSFCGYPTYNRQQHQQAQIYSWDIRMDSLCIFNFKYIIWYPVNCVNILAAVPCLNYRASNWITVWMYGIHKRESGMSRKGIHIRKLFFSRTKKSNTPHDYT